MVTIWGLIRRIMIHFGLILKGELYDSNFSIVGMNSGRQMQIIDNNGILEHDLENWKVFNYEIPHTPSIEELLSYIFASTQDNIRMLQNNNIPICWMYIQV